jgi:NAD(P)H-flavin reductase
VRTLALEPLDQPLQPFAPGQFNMMYVFGVGEVPISVSGDLPTDGLIKHTVRSVGQISRAITETRKGDVLGLRGPFGRGWPVAQAAGKDVVLIAGGVGLAPLRPAVLQLLADRKRYGQVSLLYGGRTPGDLLFQRELQRWRSRFDIEVEVTVDAGTEGWRGTVGVVTGLLGRAPFDPANTTALICGPEVMMRFAVNGLIDRGVSASSIHLSMERNMKCAVGFCGHCQFGTEFICKDGPVFPYAEIARLLKVREL